MTSPFAMTTLPSSILDHATDPQNRRAIQDADAIGRANLGGRPPEVTIFLKVQEGKIENASFEAHGCGYTIACCSVLTELAIGKTPVACLALKAEEICAEL